MPDHRDLRQVEKDAQRHDIATADQGDSRGGRGREVKYKNDPPAQQRNEKGRWAKGSSGNPGGKRRT